MGPRGRHGGLWVASTFLAVAVPLALVLPGADDEGYLTYIGARLFADEPLAALFFQKIHPTLSALYAPVAVLGWPAFRIGHVLVAAAGVALIGDAVRRFGGNGWLAAALVASSPAFLLAATAGQSNTDGVFFVAAVLNLHSRGGRSSLAGVALAGAAVWTRYEFAIPLLAIVLHALREPSRRLPTLAAVAPLPLIYLAAGAAYHQEWLWFLHYAPSITGPVPSNPIYEWMELDPRKLSTWLFHVSLAAPAWPALAFIRWRTLEPIARFLLVGLAVQVAAMLIIPMFRALFEGLGPRYMLVLSPAIAVTLAMSREVGRRRSWNAAVVGIGVLAVALSPLLPPRELSQLGATVPDATLRAAEAIRRDDRGGTVITNSHVLAVLLAWGPEALSVRFLPQHDIQFEVHSLSNHHNGQYERIIGSLSRHLYGGAAWSCSIPRVSGADRFVLIDDARLAVLYPPEYWERYTVPIGEAPGVVVRGPREGVDRLPSPPPPPGVPADVILGPCRGQPAR